MTERRRPTDSRLPFPSKGSGNGETVPESPSGKRSGKHRETVGNGGERYRLVLVPLPGDPPPGVRLRRALKALLRTYRLRCAAVEAVNPEKAG